MKAIFQTGGKQYTVAPEEEILVELLDTEPGQEVRFEDVRMVTDDSGTRVGTPRVDGAAVVGTVLNVAKGPKVRAVKFRRRKDSMTVKGHRQKYHRVRITGVEGA